MTPNANQSDVGVLGSVNTDINLVVYWQSDDGGDRAIQIRYYNGGLPVPASSTSTIIHTTNTGGTWAITSYAIGDYVGTGKKDTTLPYELSELLGLEFMAKNVSGVEATTGDINIMHYVIELNNIIVTRGKLNKVKYRAQINYQKFPTIHIGMPYNG
jgi:hypothetical protein